MGQRLLLKLQRLPQAEPVEVVAFSIIAIFTGQPKGASCGGGARAPQREWERVQAPS